MSPVVDIVDVVDAESDVTESVCLSIYLPLPAMPVYRSPVVDIVDVVDAESDVPRVDFGDDGEKVDGGKPRLHLQSPSKVFRLKSVSRLFSLRQAFGYERYIPNYGRLYQIKSFGYERYIPSYGRLYQINASTEL